MVVFVVGRDLFARDKLFIVIYSREVIGRWKEGNRVLADQRLLERTNNRRREKGWEKIGNFLTDAFRFAFDAVSTLGSILSGWFECN